MKLLLFFLGSFGCFMLFAQTPVQRAKGKVFDIDSKQPIEGASIFLPD